MSSTPYPGHDPSEPQQPPYPGASGPPGYGAGFGAGFDAGGPRTVPGPSYAPDIRPVTVTIAAWTAIGLSVLSILAGLGSLLGGSALVDYMRDHPDEAGLSSGDLRNLDDAKLGFAMVGVGLVLCSVLAIVIAVLVLKRHNWARITLVVLSGITTLVGLVGTVTILLGAPWLIGAIAVIVLLFTGGSNAWFRRSGGSRWDGPYGPLPQQPGGYPGSHPQPPPPQPPHPQSPYPQSPYPQSPYPQHPHPPQ